MRVNSRGVNAVAMQLAMGPPSNPSSVHGYGRAARMIVEETNRVTALLDRMEVIRLSGYTEDEKVEIANRHLIGKQIKNHGLRKGEFAIDDAALTAVIRTYTREAGVRNLEREIAKLARKAVTKLVKKEAEKVVVTDDNLEVADDATPLADEAPIADADNRVGHHLLPGHHPGRESHLRAEERTRTDLDVLLIEQCVRWEHDHRVLSHGPESFPATRVGADRSEFNSQLPRPMHALA